MKPVLPIPRLKEKGLRELVVGITRGTILTSNQVPESIVNLVFMPVGMGAFKPPPEVVEKLLGSSAPPDCLEGEPPKPKHPDYPEEPSPPPRPVLEKVDPDLVSSVEWGDEEEGHLEKVMRDLEEENRNLIKSWNEDCINWQSLLDVWKADCERVDEVYARTIQEWKYTLSQHEGDIEKREGLRQDWIARYNDLFSDWGKDCGPLYGHTKDTWPRSINGYPMFYEVGILHKEDWKRVRKAVEGEWERQQTLSV
jgi:hypothetical protein